MLRATCAEISRGTVSSKTTLEENNCNITKLDMVKRDADITVTGERDIDAVIRMKQEPHAVHCSVSEGCDRIMVSPLLCLLMFFF
jgi:head-tail adaptor